jgi:putative membrane protein
VEVGNNWIQKYLDPEDLEEINKAVAKAESRTTGEIVPMIVRKSTNTGHIAFILGLMFIIFLLACDFIVYLEKIDSRLYYILPVVMILGFYLALPISKLVWVQRLMTPKIDQILDVHQRAELEFYRGRFNETAKNTGVLIFLSMMEKRAVVLGDKSIAAKLGDADWQAVIDALLAKIKTGDLAGGMVAAIEKAGGLLAQHFPAEGHNLNEISNDLIIKD